MLKSKKIKKEKEKDKMNAYDFKLVTTEQISKYHPDKYADQISDKLVSFMTRKNKNSKCAIETLVKDNTVVIAGEIKGYELSNEEIESCVKEVAKDLNYKVDKIINLLGQQSLEINKAVEQEDIGAGDQGIMFGFATRETERYLPLGHDLANKIIEVIEKDVEANDILKGDAKTQVTDDNGTITKILVSVCHNEKYDLPTVQSYVRGLLRSVIDLKKVEVIINPAGVWTKGGASADSGLTGRKIVADQYGGYMAVGGGAFSGKDLTKVDRSATYIARKVAVELLEQHPNLSWVKIQVGYAIGIPTPTSVTVLSNIGEISKLVDINRFRVSNMIKELKDVDLYELSKGCHFRKEFKNAN